MSEPVNENLEPTDPFGPESDYPFEEVYKAISAVSAGLAKEGIAKDRQNTSQKYSFRGIDDVYNALAPLLAEHHLVIIPRCVGHTRTERQSSSGGVLITVVVEAEFDFVSALDGSRHTARTFGEAMDSGDKATNKAMSAAYKYAAFQTFCIPTEGDNDADATTHRPVATTDLRQNVSAENQKPVDAVSSTPVPRPTLVQPKPAPTAAPVSNPLGSPTLSGVLIKDVDIANQGKTTSGKPYKLWRVTFSDQVKATDGTMLPSATTFDDKIAEAAENFKVAGRRVSVKIEPGMKKGTYNVAEFAIQQ